ncbi:MAG: helix-turn-helix domain-containing protein, partial [Coriobacteriia bacterium]
DSQQVTAPRILHLSTDDIDYIQAKPQELGHGRVNCYRGSLWLTSLNIHDKLWILMTMSASMIALSDGGVRSLSAIRDEEYLTVAEAARLFKISQSTIWRRINQGELPAYRVGRRHIRLKAGELARLITPARQGREKGEPLVQKEQLEIGPLTSGEREQMLSAINGAKRLQAELLARRSGKPFPSSTTILRELREERTRDLR